MLILPAKAADAGFARSLHDGNVHDQSTNLAAAFLALLFGEVDQRLVGHRLHKAITEKVDGDAEGAHSFRVGHSLLDLGIGIRAIGTDGAVIDQRAARDDFCPPSDGNRGVLELTMRAHMSYAQFVDLAGRTGNRILVALAAGLRVV